MTTAIEALRKFIAQRPGLEFGNYCSGWNDSAGRAAYFAEVRSIGKDLQQARALLDACESAGLTDEQMIAAARGAYSGRLSIERADNGFAIDYCTGQYWPTEYRRAVCAVAAAALWAYWRDECMPAPCGTVSKRYAGIDDPIPCDVYKLGNRSVSAVDYLRATAQRNLGRGIAARWFS